MPLWCQWLAHRFCTPMVGVQVFSEAPYPPIAQPDRALVFETKSVGGSNPLGRANWDIVQRKVHYFDVVGITVQFCVSQPKLNMRDMVSGLKSAGCKLVVMNYGSSNLSSLTK